MATELILIRHGHATRILGEYAHAPITALGRKQAALTGLYFCENGERFDGFYSSPLRRARETAAIIGSKMGQVPVVRPGLQELESIEALPLLIMELLANAGGFGDYLREHAGKPIRWPIMGRVSTVMSEVLKKHPNQSVAVVAHGGVISSVLAWYLPGERRKWWSTKFENCSITRLKVEGSRAEVMTLNDTRHLRAELTTTQPAAPAVEVVQKV